MKPAILKVFSTCPKKEKTSLESVRNDENSVIRISHLDSENQNQVKLESLCNGNGYNEVFPFSNYDNVLNNEFGSDQNKDVNVLEDFYRFQERRNALLDNKKAINCGTQIQQKTLFERPNYSYTQLIYMAIESSPSRALTVNDIYTWCEHNFPYYAHAVHGWKNSLRHNLSINKCFKKITKIGIGGRGSLWVVDPRERQHLVSTMYRSNVTSFHQSILIQTRSNHVDDSLECVQVQCEDAQVQQHVLKQKYVNNVETVEVVILSEKPRQEWTDTRLDCDKTTALAEDKMVDTDGESLSSETDCNDWHRCMTTLTPLYPVKNHWYNHWHQTPASLTDHNYCVPELNSVLNNPSTVLRHTFLSALNPLDSFSTSSDYNDEDWPRTPSPMFLHHTDAPPPPLPPPTTTTTLSRPPLTLVSKNTPLEHTLSSSSSSMAKKRGRPRNDSKNPLTPSQTSLKVEKGKKVTKVAKVSAPVVHTHTNHMRHSATNRIDNMYNLNNFFNSL